MTGFAFFTQPSENNTFNHLNVAYILSDNSNNKVGSVIKKFDTNHYGTLDAYKGRFALIQDGNSYYGITTGKISKDEVILYATRYNTNNNSYEIINSIIILKPQLLDHKFQTLHQ